MSSIDLAQARFYLAQAASADKPARRAELMKIADRHLLAAAIASGWTADQFREITGALRA
jgi:hypothetical protein